MVGEKDSEKVLNAVHSKQKNHMHATERDICLCWQLLQFHFDIRYTKSRYIRNEVVEN